ncbi:cytochrome P450 [Coprinopsis sp. MPI-PUGE-AT-0042]|nr:cytochrome P450 [Coprinopsis sp. MPI-PUGE-AT-0042]
MTIEILNAANWHDNSVYGVGALAFTAFLAWKSSNRKDSTPPGPRKLPFVGSILSMPTSRQWEVLRDWEKVYGELIYLEGLGKKILAVNSYSLAHELLVTRATNYSDRGWAPLSDMIGFEWALPNMNYGALWRDHRRAFHRLLNQTQIPNYSTIIVQENVRFLQRLLLDKKNFRDDIKLLFGSLIMLLIKETQKFGEDYMEHSLPGRLLVTTFPSMQYIPSWLPGTGWKSVIASLTRIMLNVKARIKEGIQGDYNVGAATHQCTSNEDDPSYQYEDDLAKNIAGISFVGSTISSAIALVQRKAQEELEAVVGQERVPSFEDLDRLPYLQAVSQGVLPYGVPHTATEDDMLNGYRIPAGTLIFTNNWAIMHDANVFEDPFVFNPERYFKDGKLNTDLLDPMDVVFGYGRRICPGRHLSNAGLTMLAASLLTAFDIKQSIDANGSPIPLKYALESESSLFAFPDKFDCDIVPRSPRHAEMIHNLNL